MFTLYCMASMKASFRNLGIIESADIEIKGLTVITGLNDTGKSFIGKCLYSIIKTVKEAKDYELYQTLDAIELSFRDLQRLLRNISSAVYERHFMPFRRELIDNYFSKAPTDIILAKLYTKRDEILSDLNGTLLISQHPNAHEVHRAFNEIADAFKENTIDNDVFNRYFNRLAIQQLFRSQINSLGSDKPLKIVFSEEDSTLLVLLAKDNKTESFDVLNNIYFNDVTLIDSPIILQLAFYIRQSRLRPVIRRNNDDGIPPYYLDLIHKLPSRDNPFENSINYKEIEKIIGGQVLFKEKTDNFIFRKSNGYEVESNNTASGIKAFGILQLLIASGSINPRSLLIIDEPEVHLHPKWEVEYARVIAMLAKAGIPIIVSSHSPYFLQSLVQAVNQMEMSDITNFYFGEKSNSDTTIFKDVTADLTPIFAALSRPMQDIYIR
jgi:energy-coupling factor transporter ATP-binding protein EcfA2